MRVTLMYHGEGPRHEPSRDVYADLFEQIGLAEALGIHAVWFAEHHFTMHNGHVPQPLLLALATAGKFRRIHVGTAVVCLPLHQPLEVAEQAAMIDVLSGGRLMVGVGSGSSPMEFERLGVPMGERHARFQEGIDILLRAWTGEEFTHKGPFYTIPPTTVMPKPLQAPRDLLWIAASSERSSALAGSFGCGLMLPRGRPASTYLAALDAHRQALVEHGFEPSRAPQAIARCVYVGETDAAARDETEAAVVSFYKRFTLQGKPAEGPISAYDDLVSQLNMTIGGPETVGEQLRRFVRETGITHLTIQPTWEQLDQSLVLRSMRRFGEQVLPALA